MLDQVCKSSKKAPAVGTVNGTVVAAEREVNDRNSAQRSIVVDRFWVRGANRQDRALRWIDDCVELLDAVAAQVRDRETAAGIFFGLEVSPARAFGKRPHSRANFTYGKFIGSQDHGR